MKVNLLIATAAIALALNGCALNKSQVGAGNAGAADKAVSVVPVFVTPNCQILAGEQHCYWIEPRGMQQREHRVEPAGARRVPGIPL